MEAVDALAIVGGVATPRVLMRLTSRRKVRRAIECGLIRRAGSKLVLADVAEHFLAALSLTGVLSHLSAAQHWGWKVKTPPDRAWVTVPRHRRVGPDRRRRHHVVYADLDPEEITDGVTSPLRTVLDCAKRLPFDEALAVADSALRSGMVDKDELVTAAARVQGRGRRECLRVADAATPLAANPFESVLRALVLEFPVLAVEPQAEVVARSLVLHPDLVDRDHRIVFEADSHEFHTGKQAHDLDCERFTALGVAGWLVVRFSWEQVMLRPDYVRDVLMELVRLVEAGRPDWHRCSQSACALAV